MQEDLLPRDWPITYYIWFWTQNLHHKWILGLLGICILLRTEYKTPSIGRYHHDTKTSPIFGVSINFSLNLHHPEIFSSSYSTITLICVSSINYFCLSSWPLNLYFFSLLASLSGRLSPMELCSPYWSLYHFVVLTQSSWIFMLKHMRFESCVGLSIWSRELIYTAPMIYGRKEWLFLERRPHEQLTKLTDESWKF